jgi:excisionase family DNA binding protein
MNVYRDRDCDDAEPLLISARKAAKMLAISTRYLYTLTKERQIGVVTVGRKRLYRTGDIQRFIEDRSDGPAPVGS